MTDPFKFAQAEHRTPSRNWHNACGIFTRSAFGQPSIGDFDGDGAADAEDMWKAAHVQHPETDPAKIPRGVPVFWTGGTADNGHAAVSRGDGTVWGTDLVRDGNVDVYPITEVGRQWGLTLRGWTEDLNGVRVWTPPAPPAPAKSKPSRGTNVHDALQSIGKAITAAPDGSRRARVLSRAQRVLRRIKRK